MQWQRFLLLAVMALCVGYILLQKVSANAQTLISTRLDSPLPTPTATPPPSETPLSPEAELALQFVADREGIPIDQLEFLGQESVTFPLLGRSYTYITVQHNLPDAYPLFSLLVDPVTKLIEPDFNAVRAAEEAGYRAKYGKFEPALYDRLQQIGEADVLPIAIWVAHTEQARSLEEIAEEIVARYPAAGEALAQKGVLWAVDDPNLAVEIQRAHDQLLTENTAIRVQSVVDWFKEQGFTAEALSGMPTVVARLPKWAIITLSERSDITQIYLIEAEVAPATDVAVPTDRAPAVWARGITGSGVRIAILENHNINATADACLDIVATRASTADPGHKSRVAAIAACNDVTSNPPLKGVAYGVQILDAGHNNTQSDVVEALKWATDPASSTPAQVVNESEYIEVDTALHFVDRAYDYWVKARKFTAVIAAGNTSGNVTTPAKAYNVIGVGNVDDQGTASWSDDNMLSTSGRTNPDTNVEKPEIAAPGTNINTVTGAGTGTSYSAPQVSGLAALLMQRDVDLKNYPTAVKAIVMASALHNIEGSARLSGQDGAGSINAPVADWIAQTEGTTVACNAPCWWNISTTDTFPSSGNNVERTFNANRGERIRVVIAWLSYADPPTDTSPDGLYRNFDLRVLTPNGQTHGSLSTTNNFEIVDITAPATGQYTIRVTRNSSGDGGSEPGGNLLGIAWAKQGVYMPDVRSDGTWTSRIYVQNNGAESRGVRLTFFNAAGQYAGEWATTIASNGLWDTGPNGITLGSAIVDGGEDFSVVVVQERSGPYTGETYPGVGNPATAVRVPIVQRHNFVVGVSDWYSDLYIQNTGGVATNITLEFLPAPGYGTPNTFFNHVTVQPGARARLYTGDFAIGNAQGKFVGSVRITNSANQPLAIASTQFNTVSVNQLMETSNTQLPATVLYAPLIQNNNSNWLSGVTLSRTGGGSFDLYYYRHNDGVQCHSQTGQTANPHVVYPAIPLPTPPAGSVCSSTTPVGKFQVSAEAMVGNVNQLQGSSNATTYAAIGFPSKAVIVTKVQRGSDPNPTWRDGFVILNVSDSVAATVKVRFYNNGGVEQTAAEINTTVNARHSFTVYNQIPQNFLGSAVVTSNQPIAVSANSWRFSAGSTVDSIGSYPADHR